MLGLHYRRSKDPDRRGRAHGRRGGDLGQAPNTPAPSPTWVASGVGERTASDGSAMARRTTAISPSRSVGSRAAVPRRLPSGWVDREARGRAVGGRWHLRSDRQDPEPLGQGPSRRCLHLPGYGSRTTAIRSGPSCSWEGSKGDPGRFTVGYVTGTTPIRLAVTNGRYWAQLAPGSYSTFREFDVGRGLRPRRIPTGRAPARAFGSCFWHGRCRAGGDHRRLMEVRAGRRTRRRSAFPGSRFSLRTAGLTSAGDRA